MNFKEILIMDPSPGEKDRIIIHDDLVIFPRWIIKLDSRLENFKYEDIDNNYVGYKKVGFGHITRILKN